MSNDSKYIRLYPERAVAPLRRAAQEHLEAYRKGGNLLAVAHWEEALNALDEQGFPPDEPLFVLRGQDILAPGAVRFYASRVYDMEAFGGDGKNGAILDHIRAHADRMDAWHPRKMPD